MIFQGRIKQVLPMRSGTSQKTGNEWKALPFIFEYFENPSDRYADTVVLETLDTDIIPNIKEGMEVKIGFGHHASEYDGKYYNNLRMYFIESVKRQPQQQPEAQPQQQPEAQPQQQSTGGYQVQQPAEDETEDLPF